MESERSEVYERIPWETLETKRSDRKWLVYAVAGAISVGALAYSFARSQPLPAPPEVVPVAVASTAPAITNTSNIGLQPTIASPLVVAEADLYAIDVASLAMQAGHHAELAAVEYFVADGSGTMLPADVPGPVVPDGTQVFVDWVGTRNVIQIDQLNYKVEVVVRSLSAVDDGAFVRQPSQLLVFDVMFDEVGNPVLGAPPELLPTAPIRAMSMGLGEIPADLKASIEATNGPVIGGSMLTDGTWRVVVMATGPDGVQRPVTIYP